MTYMLALIADCKNKYTDNCISVCTCTHVAVDRSADRGPDVLHHAIGMCVTAASPATSLMYLHGTLPSRVKRWGFHQFQDIGKEE